MNNIQYSMLMSTVIFIIVGTKFNIFLSYIENREQKGQRECIIFSVSCIKFSITNLILNNKINYI